MLQLPRGWRPGMISAGVKFGHTSQGVFTASSTKSKKSKRKPISKTTSVIKSEVASEKTQLLPMLTLKKEGGICNVTMQPKRGSAVNENDEENKPVQFQIANSSCTSSTNKSLSSFFKVDLMCKDSTKKKYMEEPKLVEIGTQWEQTDCDYYQKLKMNEEHNKKNKKHEVPTKKRQRSN